MQKTNMLPVPTEAQLDALMSDWLSNLRSGENGNFTHRGGGGIRRAAPGGTTEYLINSPASLSPLELMKRSRSAAEEVMNAIVSEPVSVQVGGGDSWHTVDGSGRQIVHLATDYFDDRSLNNGQKAAIMIGLASHEAAHGAYTDEDVLRRLLREEPPQTARLRKDIWNLLEDERIEYLLGEDHPGFAANIGAIKEHYFRRLTRRLTEEGAMPTEPLPKLLSALTLAVRYPSEMTRDQVREHYAELDAIRAVLTPFPLTADGAAQASGRIMDIIRNMAREQAQRQKDNAGGQSGDSAGPGDGNNNSSGNPAGNGQESTSAKTGAGTYAGQDPDTGKPSAAEPTKEETDRALSDMLSSEQARRVLDAIEADTSKEDGRNASDKIAGTEGDETMRRRYVNEPDAEAAEGAGGGDPREFVFKPAGDQKAYAEALDAVRAYIPAMAKTLSCKSRETDYELRGLPSGRLNTNKLVALRCGNANVFDKRGTVTCSTASVVMLIDESGSMVGAKQLAARQAAVLIREAVGRIHGVNFYCYGYTTGLMNVYSEGPHSPRWALGATDALGGTPTARAMELAAERVRRFTADPCLMLVLTDGYPDRKEKVSDQDERLRGKGFQPVGVGILCSAVGDIFREHVVMDDISDFALRLGKITRGRLDRMLVRSDENE